MRNLVLVLLRYRPLVVLALLAWLAAGAWAFFKLDIEAYADPSPPLVEIITQNPAWSAEEIEQQVTVPIETVLNGLPGLQYTRSISIFGLSDIKVYFSFDTDYFRDRQEVLNRLQLINLPANLSPQLSPWSPIGEIYRFRLHGPGHSLNELKTLQDWFVRRELKQVPGVIDVTTFGGTTRQYQAEVDPRKLMQYNVTLPQVAAAVAASNANAGGGYLSLGNQNANVRGIGLLHSVEEMGQVLVAERNGAPVFLRDVADVHEGSQPRLGRVGIDDDSEIVEGVVLLQRGEQSLPALEALRAKIRALNNGLLPPGVSIRPIYDRTDLIQVTTTTVRHIILTGLVLVAALLLVFLGDVRMTLLTTLTIPLSVLFAFLLMVLAGHSANLISIGAIDFGILVDASVVVVENIYRRLQASEPGEDAFVLIASATGDAAAPVLFSTLVILVAFIPLFTMRGVPGRIFAPMSITYGFALTGAVLFALLIAPVLASYAAGAARRPEGENRLARTMQGAYARLLRRALRYPKMVLGVAAAALALTLAVLPFLGGEFMPKLEEGNLWIRATLPQDVSFEYASRLMDEIRQTLRQFPAVAHVVSQMGRPDDGTDPSSFNNLEFFCVLDPPERWPPALTKPALIRRMDAQLDKYPGVSFSFSQNIQDNVEEAMSGVKGENSLKLFGDDIQALASTAGEIRDVMATVPGIDDLGVFKVAGQLNLLISIDRMAAARYGLMASDVNAAVQAAIGGIPATQILEGDRRFDFVVRFRPEFRQDPEAIRNILLPTPEGGRIPLGQVARVEIRPGAFMVYRENGRRYVPVKFSVRGRDLASTMADVQDRLGKSVHLPDGYHYEWAGEYDSLKKEQRRLAIILPIVLVIILALLFMSFNSLRDALLVLAVLPFGIVGGVLALILTRTPFSISAAVGFGSVCGVATLGGLVFLAGIRRAEKTKRRLGEAILAGSLADMRPVLMACLAAGIGLLPAAVSSGIGAQAQQPLARVVVGGMITSSFAILFLIPLLATLRRRHTGER